MTQNIFCMLYFDDLFCNQIFAIHILQNSLKTTYESLKADLKRVEEMTRGTNATGATVAEISNQLSQFITARIQLIDL